MFVRCVPLVNLRFPAEIMFMGPKSCPSLLKPVTTVSAINSPIFHQAFTGSNHLDCDFPFLEPSLHTIEARFLPTFRSMRNGIIVKHSPFRLDYNRDSLETGS